MKSKAILRFVLPSAKSLRLMAYLLTVGVLILTSSARVLSARVKETALGFGRELVGLADLTRGAEVVHINGEQFHYSMTMTTGSVSSVLDRFERLCQTSPGLLGQLSDQSKVLHDGTIHGPFRNGVIRDEADDRGMVVCFMKPRIDGLGPLTAALDHFAQTQNLAAFGLLRYSFAQRRQDGRARVVTVWTDTGLNLPKMFPSEQDAEGTDSTILPRPPQSQRLLSATAVGATSGLRMYRSALGKHQLQQYYHQWMRENGWQVAATAEASGAAAYMRVDGCQAIVTVLNDTGETYVTLTETGSAERHVLVTGNN